MEILQQEGNLFNVILINLGLIKKEFIKLYHIQIFRSCSRLVLKYKRSC